MHTFRFTLTCRVLLEPWVDEYGEALNRPDLRLCDNHFRVLELTGNGIWEAVLREGEGLRLNDECSMVVDHVAHAIHENKIVVYLNGADYLPGEAEDAIRGMHEVAKAVMSLGEAISGWEICNTEGFVIDTLPDVSDFLLQVLTVYEPEDA